MAQNFRRYTSNDVGTGAATLFTADSYDTVVGISVSNVTTFTRTPKFVRDENDKLCIN